MNKNHNVKCAMRMTSNYLKSDPNFKPRSKYMPTLQDSYRYIFDKPEFNTSHDALDDTIRCGDIYYEIRKRIIQKEMDDYFLLEYLKKEIQELMYRPTTVDIQV